MSLREKSLRLWNLKRGTPYPNGKDRPRRDEASSSRSSTRFTCYNHELGGLVYLPGNKARFNQIYYGPTRY